MTSKAGFFKSLDQDNKYIVSNLYFMYFIQGLFTIMIGSILPMVRAEYGLSYQVGGMLISAHSVGNMAAVLAASVIPAYLGMRRSLAAFNLLALAGFAMTLVYGNPLWLIFALFLTGFGRGGVTNFNNSIISILSDGHAGPLNVLHGFFAIGALASPFIVLIFTSGGDAGWHMAVMTVIALIIVSIATTQGMRLQNLHAEDHQGRKNAFGFFSSKLFWISGGIMFFYLAAEATVMGWLVTYFIDSGVMGNEHAQILNSLFWLVILTGRISYAYLANHFEAKKLIMFSVAGITLFFSIMIVSRSLLPMAIGTIGLGFCMAGMFPTTIANAGKVLNRFPLAMGVFVTITSFGAVLMPILVGIVSENAGIRNGMSLLFAAAFFMLVFSIVNMVYNRE